MRYVLSLGCLFAMMLSLTPVVQACDHVVTVVPNGEPAAVCVGQTASGSVTAYCDQPLCSIVSYTWSAPGGDPSSGTGSSFSCSFDESGYKTVTFTATCAAEAEETGEVTVAVVGVNRVEASDILVCVNQDVTLTAISIPADKPLNCLEWQMRWKEPEPGAQWTSWTSVGGGNPRLASSAGPGYMQFRARNGTPDPWKESPEITVVDVGTIEIYDSGWIDITGQTIVLLKGTKYQFRATPVPVGASWPSNSPNWSGTILYQGSQFDHTFDQTCIETFIAKCCTGGGKSVTIEVVEPMVYQVGFDGDHDLYKTPTANGGWADGSTAIIDPVYDYDANKNDPVCVTKNSGSVSLYKVKLKVNKNLSFPATIVVDASGTEEWNESNSVTITGKTSDEATLTIAGNIINTVKKYDGNFQNIWKYKVPSGSNEWYTTNYTDHTLYIKYGNTDGGHSLTEKRIDWLCDKCKDNTTLLECSDDIYTGLEGSPPDFELGGGNPDNKWTMMDEYGPSGECISLAMLMQDMYELLGCTGGEIGFIFGSTDNSCYSTDQNAYELKDPRCTTHNSPEPILFGFAPDMWNSWQAVFLVNSYYYAVKTKKDSTPVGILRYILGDNNPGTDCSGMHQAYIRSDIYGLECCKVDAHPVPKP